MTKASEKRVISSNFDQRYKLEQIFRECYLVNFPVDGCLRYTTLPYIIRLQRVVQRHYTVCNFIVLQITNMS